MAAERDLELLDDYLANRMTGQDRSSFEQKLHADPELKAAMELQRQFIQGIKNVRVAELKAMMNAVPVAGYSTISTGAKIAIITLITAVVGTGLWLALKPEEKADLPKASTDKIDERPAVEETIAEHAQPAEEEEPKEDSPVVAEEGSGEQSAVDAPKAVTKKKPSASKPTTSPKIEVFDPSEDAETSQPSEDVDEIGTPANDNAEAITVSVNATSKRHTFHYQFEEGGLVLYGPFEKDLYEVLEFFNGDKRTIFLFHNNEYYHLKQESEKIKPLRPIKDPILLKKLREYRADR